MVQILGIGHGIENIADAGQKTTFTISQLSAGSYQVSVEAYNSRGSSGYTDTVAVTIAPKPPLTVPTGYVVQGGLLWSPAAGSPKFWSDANNYCTLGVFAGHGGWRLPTLNELNAVAASGRLSAGYYVWSSTPVSGQSSYYVVYLDPSRSSVHGRVATESRLNAEYVSCVYSGEVPAPTNLRATAGDGKVTLSWDAVPGATSYTLYRSTDKNLTPRNYTSLPGGTKLNNVSSPNVQTGLANNTVYYFTVTAVNGAGESIEADAIKATPIAASLPDGYIIQGGLLWMPVSLELDWSAANAYCTGTVINGQTGWRLPTQTEATTFKNGFTAIGGFYHPKWKTLYVWTSTALTGFTSFHYFIDLSIGYGFEALNSNKFGVTCVD